MGSLRAAAAIAAAALFLAVAACGGGGTTVAYVAVRGDNHVRIVDLESGETLRRIYTGAAPWRLALSPQDGRLWVQHWYAGETVVVDPGEDHRIDGALPFRGPGAFLPGGDWVTADWPEPGFAVVDPATLEVTEEHDSEIRQVFDLAPFAAPRRLALAQYDPMARGLAPRYGYVLSYELPVGAQGAAPAAPVTHPVGADPVRVVPVPGQPFLLTADSGTNGIHLVNPLGDRRSLAVCPAPREIALSADGRRTAVVCWRGRGAPVSRVLLLDSDYTARPWPRLDRLAEVEVAGGLVAARFEPRGRRLWVVDRSGGRLLAFDGDDLRRGTEIPVGDLPADLAITTMSRRQRELAARPPESRRRLVAALAALAGTAGRFTNLSWTEVLSWQEAAVGDGDAPPVERSRRIAVSLSPAGAMRSEDPDGVVRLAAGADAVTLDASGRFWTTPRQDLLGVVLALPAMEPEAAVRRLAGDVPGGPDLANGIAVDRVAEVDEGGERFLVVGADPAGERVSQLWIDLDSSLPVQLVERFPVFAASHGDGGAPALAETELADWRPVTDGGPLLPRSLKRTLEGSWVQLARLDDVTVDRELPDACFDAARLGGVRPSADLVAPASSGPAVAAAAPDAPLDNPFADAAPYRSNPPTSGAWLAWAPDAGVHRLPVPLPLQVHHLLDGGVALQYDCPLGCPELVAALEGVAARHDGVLVAPYPWLDGHRLALSAWGHLELADDFDGAAVEAFIAAWNGRSHHPPASAATH